MPFMNVLTHFIICTSHLHGSVVPYEPIDTAIFAKSTKGSRKNRFEYLVSEELIIKRHIAIYESFSKSRVKYI